MYAISSAIEIEKSAKAGNRTKTPTKTGRRQVVDVARDDRETIDFIGFPKIARQESHSLRQFTFRDYLSILRKSNERLILCLRNSASQSSEDSRRSREHFAPSSISERQYRVPALSERRFVVIRLELYRTTEVK